ncbi:hypothetical protein [Bradyrhizobium sp. ARR65]|uniref:hypothetical protein n=1 Tax=Bradyrhizobium sp. ARR65 TaxID=1040989 RepID=UPI000464A8F0|nr:hypothetical protein [Bradyrhizobium sp. ARR65]
MKMIASAIVIVLTTSALPALAQSSNSPNASPNVTVPSGQNSGAGIQGHPGSKSGPAARSGTVGSATGNEDNSTVRQQDPAKIQGMPGNKSGPPAKRE